jgi:uncharacterized protein YjbI with pentapeptide repeats
MNDDEASVSDRGWALVDLEALKAPPEWLASSLYAIAVIIAFLLLYMLGLGLYAFVRLGHEVAFGASIGLDTGNRGSSNSLTVFFTVLGGLIGGPFLIWRVITSHIQAQAARHQSETAREGHYTSLFTKAVEQLGATREVKRSETETTRKTGKGTLITISTTEPNLEVRLGAIYALERIAHDSERDHWPIMEVLSTYVRNRQNSGEPVSRPSGELDNKAFNKWLRSIPEPRVDVQAALTVIGRRPHHRREYERRQGLFIDLSGANLQNANLIGGNFNDAMFSKAQMQKARLHKSHLRGADLSEAQLQRAFFDGADLKDVDAWAADFSGASMDDVVLRGAKFFAAGLEAVSLSRAHLEGAVFDGISLQGARLGGAHVDGTVFSHVSMPGAELFNLDLSLAIGISSEMVDTALGDASTKLPDGVVRPANWPDKVLNDRQRGEWGYQDKEVREGKTFLEIYYGHRAPPYRPADTAQGRIPDSGSPEM